MQPIEVAVFGAVVAFAAGLIGFLLWRARRAARTASVRPRAVAAHAAGAPGMVCPACQREYEAGLQFCPHDARELIPAGDPAARAPAPGMTCPGCRRSFDGAKRFCPFDGDELVPLTLAIGSRAPSAVGGGVSVGTGVGVGASVGVDIANIGLLGKICPHCSRRYENDATFCGRDGSALVSVN
jgi:predicted amidophosphoribosyltransferase